MAKQDGVPEGLISKTETFEHKTPITEVIPAIQSYDAVIINKNDSYFGIIDSRSLYKTITGLKLSKLQSAEKFVVKVPRITDSTSIDDVTYYFYKARTKALPYMKNDKIKGILKRSTLLKVMLSLDKFEGVHVNEAMTAPVIAMDINSNVTQAKAAMRDNKINRIVVLDGNRFVGMVTNYDLIDKFTPLNARRPEMKMSTYNPSNLQLSSVVVRNPRTIDSKAPLADAAREIIENNISSIVVTKGDKPVGILTQLDLLASVLSHKGIEDNRIFISGLDADTYEYEDEIKQTLKSFISKIEKMHNLEVDHITLVVKKFKTKSYELYARLSLKKRGTINAHIVGHIFERTFSEMLEQLKEEVKEKKERSLDMRRVSGTEEEE